MAWDSFRITQSWLKLESCDLLPTLREINKFELVITNCIRQASNSLFFFTYRSRDVKMNERRLPSFSFYDDPLFITRFETMNSITIY